MRKSDDTERKTDYITPSCFKIGHDCEGILCSSGGTESSIIDMDYEDISDWK